MNKAKLLEKIAKAKSEIATAQGELEEVLKQMDVIPRAQKTTISRVVGDAFDRLRAAKADLIDLETAVTEEA